MKTKILLIMFLISTVLYAQDEIRLLFAGDLTLGKTYKSIAPAQKDSTYSFRKIRTHIDQSDLFIVNLETAITRSNKKVLKEFNFKMDPDEIKVLKAGRIDIVSIANNHTHDFGEQGFSDTKNELTKNNIAYFGLGTIYRTKIKGKTISFLGFKNDYKENEVISAIKNEKKYTDIIVVYFHWGGELEKTARKSEQIMARAAIDAGADIIIGSHPHVPQNIEQYKGKPIFYSLGNFIFGGNSRGPKTGLLAEIIVNKNITYRSILICIDPVATKYQPYEIIKQLATR